MEILIQQYLSEIFYPDPHQDIIKLWDGDDKIYGDDLIADIRQAFDLEELEAVNSIEIWITRASPIFDIPKFWEDKFFALPIARQVLSRTLALDLVEVKPMNLPSGLLFYMDPVTNDEPQEEVTGETLTVSLTADTWTDTPNANGRTYDREAWMEKYTQQHGIGELGHQDETIRNWMANWSRLTNNR